MFRVPSLGHTLGALTLSLLVGLLYEVPQAQSDRPVCQDLQPLQTDPIAASSICHHEEVNESPSRQPRNHIRNRASYQIDQAIRGRAVYQDVCASCHQPDLSGGLDAPELAGSNFISMWRGQPVRALFGYIKVAMPPAGTKPDDSTLLDIVAYILQQNGVDYGPLPLAATTPSPIYPSEH